MSRQGRSTGFTLVELMVSIALALLLVIGINAVFKMSSDTVGTGMQMGEITRQFRTFDKVFGNDVDPTHFAPRNLHPALIIESLNQPAFRDRNDELAAINVTNGYNPAETNIDLAQTETLNVRDADGNPVYPLGGWSANGINPNNLNLAFPQVLNNRNHRVDILSFFERNPNSMQRQTPNYPSGTMDTSGAGGIQPEYQGYYKSTEAWVVYGHVLQPDNTVTAENMLKFDTKDPDRLGQRHFLGLGVTQDAYSNSLYTSGAVSIPNNPNQVNPNNFYSSQWVLGRTSILMGEPSDLDAYGNPYTNKGTVVTEPQTYAKDPFVNKPLYTVPNNPATIEALRPLSWGTQIWGTQGTTAVALRGANTPDPQTQGGLQIQSSQADVAGASLQTMHEKALAAENPTATPNAYLPQWYLPLVSMGYGQSPEQPNPQALAAPPPNPASTWIWPNNPAPIQPQGRKPWHAYRFLAQAWPDKLAANGQAMTASNVPAMHQQLAVQTPIFMRGCSQFVVEYAGDYLKQNFAPNTPLNGAPTGTMYGVGEDGQIDFDVVPDPTAPGGAIKRIRWYGMTRSLDDGVSVENTGAQMVTSPAGTPGAPPLNPQIVRPLYRYIQQYTQNGGVIAGMTNPTLFTHMPFEKLTSKVAATGGPMYAGFPDSPPLNVDSYTCAWGPLEMDLDQVTVPLTTDASWTQLQNLIKKTGDGAVFPSRSLLPWMIRITIRLDDPSGRLPDGQTMQFVYTIPRPH